jgi:hypothetical protein
VKRAEPQVQIQLQIESDDSEDFEIQLLDSDRSNFNSSRIPHTQLPAIVFSIEDESTDTPQREQQEMLQCNDNTPKRASDVISFDLSESEVGGVATEEAATEKEEGCAHDEVAMVRRMGEVIEISIEDDEFDGLKEEELSEDLLLHGEEQEWNNAIETCQDDESERESGEVNEPPTSIGDEARNLELPDRRIEVPEEGARDQLIEIFELDGPSDCSNEGGEWEMDCTLNYSMLECHSTPRV